MSVDSERVPQKAGLYLHVGMPKTATSLLQKFLFPEHPEIHYLGKRIHSQDDQFSNESIQKLIQTTRGAREFLSKEDLLEIAQLSAAAEKEGKSLILSDELLSGGKLSQKQKATRLFQQHFNNCRVVIVLRDPLEFVESLYFQRLKGFNLKNRSYKMMQPHFGEPPQWISINQWLDAMWNDSREPVCETLRYADALDTYAALLGKENVKVLNFSKLKSDFDSFANDLSNAFDIDLQITRKLLAGQRVNDRWTTDNIERLKSVQTSRYLRWKYRRTKNRRQRKILLGLDEANASNSSSKAKASLSDKWKSHIEEYFAPQFKKLTAQWGFSADELGWSQIDTREKSQIYKFPTTAKPIVKSTIEESSRKALWNKIRRTDTWEDCCVNFASRFPLEVGNWFLRQLFSSKALQSRLFQETKKNLQEIESWIGRPINLEQEVCRSLFANVSKNWRLMAIGDLPWERAKKMITINGEEIIERYREAQIGMVWVNSHFGASRVVAKMMYEHGFPLTVISVGKNAAKYANYQGQSLLTKELPPTQIIREASVALEIGRSVFISADGGKGDAGIELDFLDKKRLFRTGFAQLAVKTGAPAIPFFATVDERGMIQIQIHEPLDSGNQDQPRRERINSLVKQYATLLESYWRAYPGNIRTEQFVSHQHDYRVRTAGTVLKQTNSRAA